MVIQWQKRRNYLVDKQLQVAYMKFAFHTALSFVLLASGIFLVTAGINFSHFQSLGMSAEARHALFSYTSLNLLILGGFFFAFAIISYVLSLYRSHTIAGPAFNYEKRLQYLSEGEFEHPFKSRKKDELKELEYALNQYREMAWQKFDDLEKRREMYIRRMEGLPESPQKVRLKHLLRIPPIDQLSRLKKINQAA
jgi:hypothetical protein